MTEKQAIDLIRKVAWKYYQPNPYFDFEDLVNEGYLAYRRSLQTYDPMKGATKVTWAFHHIRSAILDFIQSFKQYDCIEDHFELSYSISHFDLEDFMEDLSDGAKEACKFIFQNPFLFTENQPRKNRGLLYKKLREQGWKWQQIWDSFREIKVELAEV